MEQTKIGREIVVRVPEALRAVLDERATTLGISRSVLIRQVLAEAVKSVMEA